LTESQIQRAFEGGGATPEEQRAYATKILEKIGELRAAVNTTR
jgi:hypothetical protein